jgi:hypothetical protein
MPILWETFIQQTQREISKDFSVFINEIDIIEGYWKNNQIQAYGVKRYYPVYKTHKITDIFSRMSPRVLDSSSRMMVSMFLHTIPRLVAMVLKA